MRALWMVTLGALCSIGTLAFEYQGCFKNLDFGNGIVRSFEGFNNNADCSSFCASQGYILAATIVDDCHCTNNVPPKEKQVSKPHEQGTEYDECTVTCPGGVESNHRCIGDECCGNKLRRRTKMYSVYAVGAINPIRVYLNRIYKSLVNRNHPWLDIDLQHADWHCENKYRKVLIQHGFLTFDMKKHRIDFSRRDDVTLEQCQQACSDSRACRSITYFPISNKCYVNDIMSYTGDLTLTHQDTILMDRICSKGNVKILPSTFDIMVVKQTTGDTIELQSEIDRQATADDLELDLTKSASWETIQKTVAISSAEDRSLTHQSGLDFSQSSTTSQEQSTDQSSTTGSSSSDSSTFEAGFGVQVSASVGADFFFGSASVEASASTDTQFSDTTTHARSSSKTFSRSSSKETSKSNSLNRMMDFTSSWASSSDSTHVYEYSMTVPALHKGKMQIFTKKSKKIRSYVTLLQLQGYVKLQVARPDSHETEVISVNVARLLSPRERYVQMLTSYTFPSKTIVAAVTITDPDGIEVQDASQIIPK